MKKVIVFLIAMPLLGFSSLASALTCDDVVLSAEITSRYADAQSACIGIVERDGETFVKMNVELVRDGTHDSLTFKFINADGSYGPIHSVTTAPDWRTRIQGRSYRSRELARGQQMSVYLPSDRWEAHVAASDVVVETFTLVIIREAQPEPMMLPSTASNMPLFALFGGLALFAAGLIRVSRRQAS